MRLARLLHVAVGSPDVEVVSPNSYYLAERVVASLLPPNAQDQAYIDMIGKFENLFEEFCIDELF
jgi:hypothetical protein